LQLGPFEVTPYLADHSAFDRVLAADRGGRPVERVAEVAYIRRFREDLAAMRGDVVFYGTSSTARELVEDGCLHGGAVVWSIWDDYLDAPAGQKLQALLAEAEVPLLHHHSSGHAYVGDLARLVEAFAPARVVPIHSEAGDRFGEHFPRVERHADGERWTV
jgi:ribonuclease J